MIIMVLLMNPTLDTLAQNSSYSGNNLYTSNHSNGSKGNVKNVYWLPEQLFYGTLHTERH